ncbi:MAG TPA: VPLPA-CTERM sorting domain-containing protein [Gammaproteobacteria bacterium]
MQILQILNVNWMELINMKKTAIAAALLLLATGVANADTVTSITITGGDFGMGAPAPADCTTTNPYSSYQCITGSTTFTEGQVSSGSTAMFNFFNAPVSVFLGATATGAAPANDWTDGFQGTVDADAGTMSLNLGGFYANWSGSNFLQGTDSAETVQCAGTPEVCASSSAAATGTVDMVAGTFDVTWSSFITTAPFAGQTGYWHITGTFESVPDVAPVPVPAAVWLFGSGLVGLAGIARRRKAA